MLSSLINREKYTGNGSTNVYSYGCRIYSASELRVTVRLIATGVETRLALATDYTVSGVGNSTGNISLVNSSQAWLDGSGNLTSAYILVTRRVRPLTQSASIRNQGAFYAATHEDVFDKLVMDLQQHWDEISRSFRLPETFSSADFNPTIPVGIIGVPGATLATDSNTGTTLVPGPTVSSISSAAGAAAAAIASAAAAAASAISAAASASSASASATAAAASAASVAAPTVVGNSSSPTLITAAGGIAFTSTAYQTKNYVAGNGSAITVTKNPQVVAGTKEGQQLRLVATDGTNTVELQDGNGLKLNGIWIGGVNSFLDLDWDNTASVWVEAGRSMP